MGDSRCYKIPHKTNLEALCSENFWGSSCGHIVSMLEVVVGIKEVDNMIVCISLAPFVEG